MLGGDCVGEGMPEKVFSLCLLLQQIPVTPPMTKQLTENTTATQQATPTTVATKTLREMVASHDGEPNVADGVNLDI